MSKQSKKQQMAAEDQQQQQIDDTSAGFTTSDGGKKISMQGSKKAATASTLATVVSCLFYAASQTGLTLINKQIFTQFPDLSPLNLLMVQCLINVTICLILMTIKEVRVSTFSKLARNGIVIPELSKIIDKAKIGMRFGLANLFSIILGLYALKHASLPS